MSHFELVSNTFVTGTLTQIAETGSTAPKKKKDESKSSKKSVLVTCKLPLRRVTFIPGPDSGSRWNGLGGGTKR